eukprot:COSAG06_NODE_2571_length_6643_cov_3.735789_3_plen_58_part_00
MTKKAAALISRNFGIMLGGAVIGGAVVTGAMGVLSDYGVITDLRILVSFYQILGQAR